MLRTTEPFWQWPCGMAFCPVLKHDRVAGGYEEPQEVSLCWMFVSYTVYPGSLLWQSNDHQDFSIVLNKAWIVHVHSNLHWARLPEIRPVDYQLYILKKQKLAEHARKKTCLWSLNSNFQSHFMETGKQMFDYYNVLNQSDLVFYFFHY